jgi:hypothetical protein
MISSFENGNAEPFFPGWEAVTISDFFLFTIVSAFFAISNRFFSLFQLLVNNNNGVGVRRVLIIRQLFAL